MSLKSDLKTLYHLTLRPTRGHDHAARMDDFYADQAATYDSFRRRFLHGRKELYEAIHPPAGGTWVDLGAGTGWCLEQTGDRLRLLNKIYLVDLSRPMLNVADERIARLKWSNVETVHADAIQFQPDAGLVDVVTLSYSLTMIPDWFAAIDHAWSILKPGGIIGVTDFYVSRKRAGKGMEQHSRFTRAFWPTWFDRGDVFLSHDHVPYLLQKFQPLHFTEARGRVPYLLPLRIPHYVFIGRKTQESKYSQV